jgi:MASE1
VGWSIGLAVAVGIVYFVAARLSLALLTKPEGVAVFWPAAGVSAGVLIALGSRARWPVVVGTMAATIVANLLGDRNLWSSARFALCNAGEALLTAWLIGHYFGSDFRLSKLRNVLGLAAAAITGTAVSGIGGAVAFKLFHSATTPILTPSGITSEKGRLQPESSNLKRQGGVGRLLRCVCKPHPKRQPPPKRHRIAKGHTSLTPAGGATAGAG